MNWAEKSEKPPLFLTKTENQRLTWRKPAKRTRHQNRKPAIIESENRKTESKIGQIRHTENPNAPLDNQSFFTSFARLSELINRTSI